MIRFECLGAPVVVVVVNHDESSLLDEEVNEET